MGVAQDNPNILIFLVHRDALWSYLVRETGSEDIASDLVQDAFLRFACATNKIEQPKSYLFRIAKNLVADHRRRAVHRTSRSLDERTDAPLPSTEHVVHARQRMTKLWTALEELPPRKARIFRLHRIEGWSYRKIATQLSVSESTVQKDLAFVLHYLTEKVFDE